MGQFEDPARINQSGISAAGDVVTAAGDAIKSRSDNAAPEKSPRPEGRNEQDSVDIKQKASNEGAVATSDNLQQVMSQDQANPGPHLGDAWHNKSDQDSPGNLQQVMSQNHVNPDSQRGNAWHNGGNQDPTGNDPRQVMSRNQIDPNSERGEASWHVNGRQLQGTTRVRANEDVGSTDGHQKSGSITDRSKPSPDASHEGCPLCSNHDFECGHSGLQPSGPRFMTPSAAGACSVKRRDQDVPQCCVMQ